MKKFETENLSTQEENTILKGVKVLLDIIVSWTGGRPMFGGK